MLVTGVVVEIRDEFSHSEEVFVSDRMEGGTL